jgi:hypothetical protein
MHYGVPGMRWGHRKSEYTYAKGQKPKNAYQKVARSIGGTKFAKNAILKNKNLNASGKHKALNEYSALADEKAYNKAKKKASKTGGRMTYDVATGKYSVSKNDKSRKPAISESTFNKLKKGANAALDKADRDNFFNSDSIFSEKSMKTQSRIDRARDAINSLDYKTLTGSNRGKQLKSIGKKFIEDSLDDSESRSFFNDDWDTRMKKEDRNDRIREFLK